MSSQPYYSQRQGHTIIRNEEQIGQRFWDAFSGYIHELEAKDYFAGDFPEECPDRQGTCSWASESLRSRIIGELPQGEWPLPTDLPSKEAVFDFVEYFYRVVTVPSGTYHSFFRHTDYHSFDKEKAQAEYNARINQYLWTCRHPYDLIDGQIQSSISPVLDTPLREEEFIISDHHLLELLRSAVSDFYDKSGNKKRKALEALVDAYDRLKTIEHGDKKQSVNKLLSNLSIEEAVRQNLNDDMKVLTQISNDFTIRHHEMQKRQLGDDDFVEYLFYAYYNVVRLILKKYNKLTSTH